MQASPIPEQHNAVDPLHVSMLLPVKTANNSFAVTCHQCGFVNACNNNFCTNCGHPFKAVGDNLAIYNYRKHARQQTLDECKQIVLQARGTLYIMALICLVGSTFFSATDKASILRSSVMLLLSGGYFILARWSISKPFSALLIGFLMVVSFMAINTWAQFRHMLTTGAGLLLLFIQIVVFYFVFRGVKAAYHADVLEEEDRI